MLAIASTRRLERQAPAKAKSKVTTFSTHTFTPPFGVILQLSNELLFKGSNMEVHLHELVEKTCVPDRNLVAP